MRSRAFGLALGLLLGWSVTLYALPTPVAWDASTCPAGTYTLTATASSPDDPQTYQTTLVGVTLPQPTVSLSFGNLPQRDYTVNLAVSGTQSFTGQPATVRGLGDPVPTPTPTPQASLAIVGLTEGQVFAAGSTVTFQVAYAGVTAYTVELLNNGGVVVLTRTRPLAGGTLAASPSADGFSLSSQPDGLYTIRLVSGATVSAPVGIVIGAVPTPTPTPTPTVTLDQVLLEIQRVLAAVTQPTPTPLPIVTCTVTSVGTYANGDPRVTVRCPVAELPLPTTGTAVRIVK